MRVTFTLSMLLLLCLALTPGILTAQTDGEIDWDYEIDLLGRELAEKHPKLFFKTDSAVFFRELKKVASEAPGKSHFYISVKLQQVMAKMGDAHTLVNYHFHVDKSLILPFESYWFEDGIYVTQIDRKYEALLGKKLTAINGTPLKVVIDSLSTLLVHNNQSLIKYHIPRMLTWSQLLLHFGFSDMEKVTLHVVNEAGTVEQIPVTLPTSLGENVEIERESVPLGWQDQKAYFREHYFADERIYYIQYNRCWSREVEEDFGSGATALFMSSFKEFEKQVFQVIRKKEVDKLIFDLRFNNGGHPAQGKAFIEKLRNAKIKGKGEFYLLVGRKTSSEAMINAVDFMIYAGVVVVGEESGGRPNHFGEVRRFVLPESGLIVSHSTRYFALMEEDLPAISPDIEAPETYEQYIEGVDPALEAVRNHELP
ncbi:MAG: hypothetical protein KAR16_06805 [Bacteroidales bacterium]|nr:hypothetical protein [Bacteroidales bacterium]